MTSLSDGLDVNSSRLPLEPGSSAAFAELGEMAATKPLKRPASTDNCTDATDRGDSASELRFFIGRPGTTVGTDYSQLSATGTVSLASAHLAIWNPQFEEQCPVLKPGDVDTLVTTAGSVSGTFSGVPDGSTIALECRYEVEGGGTPPTVKINYTAHTVTATVVTSGSSGETEESRTKREAEEAAAKKHQEEEAAAKKHQEDEAAVAKKHAEEAAATKKREEEAAAKKHEEEALTTIASSLSGRLGLKGKTAKIGALLKHGSYSFSFSAPVAGTLVISWFTVPKSGHHAVLVAAGRVSFSTNGSLTVTVKLTVRGKQLLKHATNSTKLTAKGTFTPMGKAAVVAVKTFTLKR